MKAALETWRASVFLELPETSRELFLQVQAILQEHVTLGDKEDLKDWELAVADVWRGD